MLNTVKKLVKDERGQGMVEYAMMAALVSAVGFAAFQKLGGSVVNSINSVTDKVGGSQP